MKGISISLCLVAILISCKEITFKEPQPKGKRNLTSVPAPLHGKYLTQKEDGDYSQDTIIITKNGYRFGYYHSSDKTGSQYDSGVLSDSIILRTYKGYYFLNLNDRPEWMLRIIMQEKSGDIIYMVPEQSGVDFKDYIKKLSAEIEIDSGFAEGEMLYQIDPSPTKLVALIGKGYFSRTRLRKIR